VKKNWVSPQRVLNRIARDDNVIIDNLLHPTIEGATALQVSRRRGDYHPSYAALARKCAMVYGTTKAELATFFGVPESAISRWTKDHADFADALRITREQVDAEVAVRLFRRATGYSCPATKIFMTEDGPVSVSYTEHYPPDTAAAIFWLRVRQREKWNLPPGDDEGGEGGTLQPRVTYTVKIGNANIIVQRPEGDHVREADPVPEAGSGVLLPEGLLGGAG